MYLTKSHLTPSFYFIISISTYILTLRVGEVFGKSAFSIYSHSRTEF
jgi:hypothetical protein